MGQKGIRWCNEQLRTHVQVVDQVRAPHILLKNATYLNVYVQKWLVAHIWIYEDRIVYVGEQLPEQLEQCEVIDCTGKYIVPGYIEPHVHPAQLYNPESFAYYAGMFGTTTCINDNLAFCTDMSTDTALRLLDDCQELPISMYWWCRFDAQTELPNEAEIFHTEAIERWLQHESVVQGGELTAWPKVMAGDEDILAWMQEARRLHKKVEGHFPGASERTLAKMHLLGADCDHEAMTGAEAMMRLTQGYYVSLRHSSIRPDLDILLQELLALGLQNFDRLFMTTDGSHPYFYEQGVTDVLIKKAIGHGVPIEAAYQMASYNIARYYNMEHLHGAVAIGRIANLNIIASPENPTPISVLAKGQWLVKDGSKQSMSAKLEWSTYDFSAVDFQWDLEMGDFEWTTAIGIELVNNVIARRYDLTKHIEEETLDVDECFLMMVARDGTWRVNTVVRGFASQVSGFASSYSGPGHVLLLGKSKADMLQAFRRVKALGGGMVLVEEGEVLHELPLPINGRMSDSPLESLIVTEKKMIALLKERGYKYEDPAFTLYFFSATHLPFIRITPKGLFDVKNQCVLAAPIARESVYK